MTPHQSETVDNLLAELREALSQTPFEIRGDYPVDQQCTGSVLAFVTRVRTSVRLLLEREYEHHSHAGHQLETNRMSLESLGKSESRDSALWDATAQVFHKSYVRFKDAEKASNHMALLHSRVLTITGKILEALTYNPLLSSIE